MLEQIKNGMKLGKEKFSETEIEWLIQQAEKVLDLRDCVDYVLSAEVEHYRDKKHMLEDFKTVITMSTK